MALKSSKAAKLFNSLQKAQVSWTRIKPLLKEYVEPNTQTTIDFSQPVKLLISNLSIGWPESPCIIKDISFSASPGQIIGVTGPIACGKSTLGKAFIGEVPYTGSIQVWERELSQLNDYERSRLISYMGHESELMSDSIRENIQLGEQMDITPYLQAVCFDEEVAQMPQGDSTLVGNNGIRLSGGQQARTALARTLYNSQKVLILDNPFSSVDRITEREIFKNLLMLTKDKIVILISHRLYLFPEFDKVLFLDNSTGVFSTHRELIQENGTYAKLYNTQVEKGEQNE